MQFLQKKVDSSKYSSSSVATRVRRPTRGVGTFNQSSLLRCRFAPHSGSQIRRKLRSKTSKKTFFHQLEKKRHQSVVNANFCDLREKKKKCDDGPW